MTVPRKGAALVTGASSGIGLELARVAARDGHSLVLVARSRPRLEALARELEDRHGTESLVLVSDLADPGEPKRLFARCGAAGIEVDVLANNAGFGAHGRFVDTDLAAELEMVRVNVEAVLELTKLFGREMVRRGRGRILNVASTAAFQPGPLMAVYYASKAFVLSFSEALAEELAGTGVTVTALCPGVTRTGFHRRAGIESARVSGGLAGTMSAASVARTGWTAMQRGRRVVIPGVVNRTLIRAGRIAPRRLTTRVVRKLQERR